MKNQNSVAKFGGKNQTRYAGDILAPEIIRLARKYVTGMARHPFLKYFSWIFKKIGKFQPTNLFVICENG